MLSWLLKLEPLKHKKVLLALTYFIFACLSFSCGKRKPPLPPVEKVPQRVEISGFQRGDQVIITWTMPARNASDSSVLNISRADVYRLTEAFSSKSPVSEEDFASRSTQIDSVEIADSDFGRKRLTYTDKLSFAGQAVRIRYAVRLANAQGQKAGFSNFLVIEPSPRVANAATGLSATVSQEEISLRWSPPESNIDGSTPANIVGFNIYRAEEKQPLKLLNPAIVTASAFADRSFLFDRQYGYLVRTVSLGSNGEPVESSDSVSFGVSPQDKFAPAAPAAVTIAATPSTISIFFATNLESDVAGYRIYRSTDRNKPESEWSLISPEPLLTNTFQDIRVESGQQYFYFITAVDKVGNVSSRSDIVSETVP